jgi:hypothetical protein
MPSVSASIDTRRESVARRWAERRLYLFSLHAHLGSEAVEDYRELFAKIASLRVTNRALTTADSLTALRTVDLEGDYVKLVVYEGPPGIAPLIFDLSHNEERITRLTSREVMATRTHAIVNLKNRDVAVEYNQRGAKARDIAELLALAGKRRRGWTNLIVELAPVASPDFAKAIDEFQTIKIASLNVVRPNLNWIKEKRHADAIAEESNGNRVEIAVFAGGGDGLNKRRGMVGLIRGLTRERRSNLKDASVTGRRLNETADTTISLERHLEHRIVRVARGEGGHPERASVEAALIEFLQAREKQLSKRRSSSDA